MSNSRQQISNSRQQISNSRQTFLIAGEPLRSLWERRMMEMRRTVMTLTAVYVNSDGNLLDRISPYPTCGPVSGVVPARADSWTLENVQERLQKMEEVIMIMLVVAEVFVDQARNERKEALSMILQERRREGKFEARYLLNP